MKSAEDIRPATVADAEAIVAAVRDGFDGGLLEMFIYGCDGIAAFVAEEIAVQEQGGDTHFTVALAGGEVAACAEVRRYPHCLSLNYIAVRPAFRSKGLAGRLLREAMSLAGMEGRREMTLDVLTHNAVPRMVRTPGVPAEDHDMVDDAVGAGRFFARIVEGLCAPSVSARVRVLDVRYRRRGTRISGRPVGKTVVSLDGNRSDVCSGLLAALSRMDPARRILFVRSARPRPRRRKPGRSLRRAAWRPASTICGRG